MCMTVSITKLNFMIASLIYNQFSYQEHLTNDLAVTYILEYRHDL